MLLIEWEEFSSYLYTEAKLKRERVDLPTRFKQIKNQFQDKDFNRRNVVSWFNDLKSQGRRNSTLNNLLTLTNHCCNYLVYIGELEKNFMDGFSYFEEEPCTLDVLTEEETLALVRCEIPRSRDSEYINFRWSLIIEILSIYVFRVNELGSLKWKDNYDGETFIIKEGKTSSSISKIEVLPYLREKINKLRRFEQHDYIFGSYKGRLDDASLSKEIKKRLQLLGINKKITPHSLRRSGITNYIDKDVNRFKLIKVTRHKNFNSLNRYNHLAYKSATDVLESNLFAEEHLSFDSISKKVVDFYESIKDLPCQKSIEQDTDYVVIKVKRKDMQI